jgi:8-oxo-dGTP pyrophosphatase MutT (NUDIX family)
MAGKSKRPHLTRRQVAALPFRMSNSRTVEILVLTSRETSRFVIPKGWRKRRLDASKAAAREAFEEAGIVGIVGHKPIGTYTYWKRQPDRFERVKVKVFPLEVQEFREEWPEKGQRRMAWLSTEDAALLVDEPDLSQLIRSFGRQ